MKRNSKRSLRHLREERFGATFHVRGDGTGLGALCDRVCTAGADKKAVQRREAQRIPALKEDEESFHVSWKLNWVVTPADGPCIGSVSLFIFAKSDEQCEAEARLALRNKQ